MNVPLLFPFSLFSHSDDGDDCEDDTETADMPFDLDIEVEALALDDHEIDRLRADTA